MLRNTGNGNEAELDMGMGYENEARLSLHTYMCIQSCIATLQMLVRVYIRTACNSRDVS